MTTFRLISQSLFHYRWINLSVLAGVALTSAILSGALVVGDSVKESLRQNAEARLSNMGPVFVGGERYVTNRLADRVGKALGGETAVAPVLQIEGTASNRAGGKRVNKVQILGVDDRFWNLSIAGRAPEKFSDDRWIAINEPFARRIEAGVGDSLIMRVEIPGALSKDAPLSGESEQTTPFTVKVSEVIGDEFFGLYSLRAEQVPPSTLFVKLSRLQEILETPKQVNLLATGKDVDARAFATAVGNEWSLDDLQIEVEQVGGNDLLQVVSSRVFFDEAIVFAFGKIASIESPILTYLATEIRANGKVTPYSMVTGVGPELNEIVNAETGGDGIVLSQWIADDLQAKPGDEVTLAYNVVGPGRALIEQTRSFRVAGISAIGENGWDQSWTPDFPGIFDVEDLDEWEPGIPIDRDKIRDKDDEFWDEYRATPKAFVGINAAREMWANRFGNATSLRLRLNDSATPVIDQLRPHLPLESLGMAVRDMQGEAESAVSNSFDFGSLFASMSFFLIVAALALTGLVFVFGIEQRSSQIGLLLALGFTRKRVRKFFIVEAVLLSIAGALLGLAGGYIYTRLALHGMSGVWSEAAAGIDFVYHLKPATLAISFSITVFVALFVVWWTSRRVTAVQPGQLISGGDTMAVSGPGKGKWAMIFLVLGLLGGLGCLFAPKVPGTIAEQGMFFGAGFLFTLAGVALASLLIGRFLRPSNVLVSIGALGRQHTVRRKGRSLAVIGLMAAGVFMVTAINSFRLDGERGAERRGSGTGGFAWVGESTLPVYEDLNGKEGREKYGLDGFEESFTVIPFRVSDGEDASCLNLNRAQRPRLMGVNPQALADRDAFTFTKVSGESDPEKSNWSSLGESAEQMDGISVVPGIIDQNTAIYALQKGVGDIITYETVSGQSFGVRIVGFLDTSILQGSLLISEENFIRFFPDSGGYQFFLLDRGGDALLDKVAAHMTRMFGDLGLEMRPAADRLNEFNAVQNTYLSIFSTLGGLGIFLGTLGLAIIVGRNVLERRGQLGVMQAMGFTRRKLVGMVLSEHWFLHVSGVLLGLLAALVAVIPQLAKGLASLPWGLLIGVNAAVLIGGLIFCAVAAKSVLRGNLMEAIRKE
ncbi:MAG: FtsX-like permease family protein [Verrucomicrobiales bacterium]|nr:FtsX-like permease family protein [Verrucomicrobiales bacterium]